jgi:hypothetical protein
MMEMTSEVQLGSVSTRKMFQTRHLEIDIKKSCQCDRCVHPEAVCNLNHWDNSIESRCNMSEQAHLLLAKFECTCAHNFWKTTVNGSEQRDLAK